MKNKCVVHMCVWRYRIYREHKLIFNYAFLYKSVLKNIHISACVH